MEKSILLKVNNIIKDEENPFIHNYYNKIIKIRDILKKMDKKLYPYRKIYDYNKDLYKLNDILTHGWYNDNFGSILDSYIINLEEFLQIIENILKNKEYYYIQSRNKYYNYHF